MRISGLATGMDTESIIRDMMNAQRIPLNKITQKKQYLEWQLDDYRSINRNINTFSNNIFDTIMKQGTFLAKAVNISNPDSVSIKSTTATSEFAGTISVQKLATQATLQGGKIESAVMKKSLAELEISENASFTVTAIDKDGNMVESKPIEFDLETDTIESILKKINSGTGVSAFHDSFTEQIALTSKNSGTSNIVLSDDLKNLLKMNGNETGYKDTPGQNAEFTFNGLATERSSNSFQINGFEITLKQENTGPITFSSSPDTDKIFDSVKKFVDDYNKLIEELNAKIREPKHRTFHPLSDEQKQDMKEKEIEMWEEKAMSGTLRNDPIISSMLQQMRTALTGTVKGSDGQTIHFSNIGITTGGYQENGKLIIDETKLREAIAEDPNKVYEVFASTRTGEGELGLVGRLRTAVEDGRKSIAARAGNVGAVNDTFTLGRTLKEMNNQISRFEDRLKMVEDRYWKQFTAMERAIQRSNAQSAYLMNAFGGGM